ncbi:hypothetical protein [Cellulomonas triticagri]|uniref:Uncharacterized protein n=1 Tax=Cellulomonas triticagri TaxID=2483352 RepID=A0A3M2JKD2_9CELL|nr:hypothetical protein [Cellulomonas triticagri]RMI13574.1 hypothetical protein EBM89_03965 [Cellulomonas triticagri]
MSEAAVVGGRAPRGQALARRVSVALGPVTVALVALAVACRFLGFPQPGSAVAVAAVFGTAIGTGIAVRTMAGPEGLTRRRTIVVVLVAEFLCLLALSRWDLHPDPALGVPVMVLAAVLAFVAPAVRLWALGAVAGWVVALGALWAPGPQWVLGLVALPALAWAHVALGRLRWKRALTSLGVGLVLGQVSGVAILMIAFAVRGMP